MPVPLLNSRFPAGTSYYLATEFMTALTTILGVLLFTRLVPPQTYGFYSLIMAAGSMGVAVASEWLQLSAVRFLPAVLRPSHQASFLRAFGVFTVTGILILSLAAVIGFILVRDPPSRNGIVLGWAYSCCGVLFFAGTSIFQARLEARRFFVFRGAFSVLRIVAALTLVLLYGRTYQSMVSGQILALGVLLIPLLRLLWPKEPSSWPRTIVQGRKITDFGVPLIGWFLANQVLNISDRFLVGAFLGAREVGLYAVTYSMIVGVVAACLQPLHAATFPLVIRTLRVSGEAEAGQVFNRALRWFLILLPYLAISLSWLGIDAIRVLVPQAYGTSSGLIILITCGVLTWNLGLYFQKILEMKFQTGSLMRWIALAALVNVGANLFLIPRWGLPGAAVATLVAYGVYLLLILAQVAAILPINVPRRFVWSLVMGSLLLAALQGWVVRAFEDQSPWLRILVGGGIGTVAYGGFLALRNELRPISIEDREDIRGT